MVQCFSNLQIHGCSPVSIQTIIIYYIATPEDLAKLIGGVTLRPRISRTEPLASLLSVPSQFRCGARGARARADGNGIPPGVDLPDGPSG
ncbi:hypothetical protein BDN70DRAFT_871539 [Pholiota conissans]|uniref:Uncharacterized protein n=1 Tax=Pholiota conissans TaxID=109636 RepID=A0A9P5ZFX1_9AGAR|nr:hypothetical protein BDN70DRAFT_871539 [Pholiota conissans]